MDYTELRAELHRAVDSILDAYIASNTASHDDTLTITPSEVIGSFDYPWPAQPPESFTSGRWYKVSNKSESAMILVAWAKKKRLVWRKDRDCAVVFARVSADPTNLPYPCVEFTQTDKGSFAAIIPDPNHPRAVLSKKEQLPKHLAHANVAPVDELFDSIKKGPSLRLVVDQDDEIAMAGHGYWVAQLRGRI